MSTSNLVDTNTNDANSEMAKLDQIASKAMKLLGNGYTAEVVASACGVSASRISQLMSIDWFAEAVAELKFNNLQKHNAIDNEYDEMEQELIVKMKQALPLMMRPMEIMKAISVVNAAKRKGSSNPVQAQQHQTIVNLTLPKAITQRFEVNINNQVVSVGTNDGTNRQQTLVTVQSSSMLANAKHKEEVRNELANRNELRTIDFNTGGN